MLTGWTLALFDRRVAWQQVAIMEAMDWIGEPFSPVQFAAMSDTPVSQSGYHFSALAKVGLIEVVDTQPVRGAVEHFYAPTEEAE